VASSAVVSQSRSALFVFSAALAFSCFLGLFCGGIRRAYLF